MAGYYRRYDLRPGVMSIRLLSTGPSPHLSRTKTVVNYHQVMPVVYKYKFDPANWIIKMPAGSTIVHAGFQDGELYIWAFVDSANQEVERKFIVLFTGEETDRHRRDL